MRPRSLVVTLAAILALLSTYCAPDRGKLRVTVIDVGQGESIDVETPSRHTMLVDGGGSNDESAVDPADVGRKSVIPYLRYRGIGKVDVVVLTHPHSDHDGTVLSYNTPSYDAFLNEVAKNKNPKRQAEHNTHLDFGDGVTADVLN